MYFEFLKIISRFNLGLIMIIRKPKANQISSFYVVSAITFKHYFGAVKIINTK
ncbi:MAG: hypothetical protein L6V78_01590 [Clostridium sp.]|nr:MAG: hypothetical protein L6V78_01590 [Clostridium sp.]